jgi:urease accessory protein
MQRATHLELSGHWPGDAAAGTVTLGYDDRHRRRMRLITDAGEAFLLDLERATLLRDGDGLRLDDGRWIAVSAAAEDVIDVHGETSRATARLAWHLGNRHLPVQILEDGGIRFRYDHVIEDMIQGLGGRTERKSAPFSPEGGAYEGGHGHAQGQSHGHHHHNRRHDEEGHGHG